MAAVQVPIAYETDGVPEVNGCHGINRVDDIHSVKEVNGYNNTNGVYPVVNGHARGSEMKCEPPSGIDVLVVGAGLGGMFAAVELQRQGHQVKILEAKEKMEGLGKAFSLIVICLVLVLTAARTGDFVGIAPSQHQSAGPSS